MEKNLTTGSVFKNVVLFSLPYLLSYFLQTLYGMADLFIIGQFEGVASTTAVSIGSQAVSYTHLLCMGMAQRGEFVHGMDDAEFLELPIAEQVAEGAEVDFRILQQLVHGEYLLPCR